MSRKFEATTIGLVDREDFYFDVGSTVSKSGKKYKIISIGFPNKPGLKGGWIGVKEVNAEYVADSFEATPDEFGLRFERIVNG